MNYKISGVNSIILHFGESISDEVFKKVNSAYKLLKQESLDEIIELVPSYTTLFIEFDLFKLSHEELFTKLNTLLKNPQSSQEITTSRTIEIPVYYDSEVGFDLQRVATLNKLSIDEVIKLHTQQTYRVYTIGFAPAFGYMGTVDKKIATPRLETPRKKIPKNSVALADKQTAIYPNISPGGWNILGRTYLNMFDKEKENFSYLKVGDRVEFKAITKEEFLANGGEL